MVDGVDVLSLSVRWLRSQIGLVSQEPVLFSGSIGWNIGLGASVGGSEADAAGGFGPSTEAAVTQAARLANAHTFVGQMPHGYATDVGEKGVQLSGGQKQRIAITCALVREPATSALDAESERVVQQALDELLKGSARTTLVIAHRLSIIRHADKIAVISGGAVVEEGPHDELAAKEGGIYKALVEAQQSAHAVEAKPPADAPAPTSVEPVVDTAMRPPLALEEAAAELVSETLDPETTALAAVTMVEAASEAVAEVAETLAAEPDASTTVAPVEGEAMGEMEGETKAERSASSPDGAPRGKTGKKVPKEPKAKKSKEELREEKLLVGATRRWLWKQTAPEAWCYVTGLTGAAITGLTMPAIGYLMAQFVVVFYHYDRLRLQPDAGSRGACNSRHPDVPCRRGRSAHVAGRRVLQQCTLSTKVAMYCMLNVNVRSIQGRVGTSCIYRIYQSCTVHQVRGA